VQNKDNKHDNHIMCFWLCLAPPGLIPAQWNPLSYHHRYRVRLISYHIIGGASYEWSLTNLFFKESFQKNTQQSNRLSPLPIAPLGPFQRNETPYNITIDVGCTWYRTISLARRATNEVQPIYFLRGDFQITRNNQTGSHHCPSPPWARSGAMKPLITSP
jgi:hypothetical protein